MKYSFFALSEAIKNPLRRGRYKLWIFIEKFRGIDFTTYVGLDDLKLSAQRSNYYLAVTPRLKRLLKTFNITDKDCIVDLGCGKGKALYYMHSFDFCKIYGVELSTELCNIANANIQKLFLNKCEVINADAGKYELDNKVNYIFMNNPFPSAVVKEVMANIYKSLERKQRKITIIYLNPVCHDDIIATNIFKEIKYWKNYRIYTNE